MEPDPNTLTRKIEKERTLHKKEKAEVAKILSRTLNELKRTKWSQERLMLQITSLQNKRLEEKQALLDRHQELATALAQTLRTLKSTLGATSSDELQRQIAQVQSLLEKENPLHTQTSFDMTITSCRCMP